ncbi:hypothetical protein [Clavibacter michiganensis]|uniref:hypothetical protein n=1 Tax=Clavibacter michiganensis TaxID=28447 RepID=UPI00292DBB67|nr:hypothetical protein [Clavibacter michiganensis]
MAIFAIFGGAAAAQAETQPVDGTILEYVKAEGTVNVTGDDAALTGPGGAFGVEASDAAGVESASAVIDEGLGAQLTTELTDPATTSVTYDFAVPAGTTSEVFTNESDEQSVILRTASGEFLGGIVPTSAIDADGKEIPTATSVEGTTMTQEITLTPSEVKYPVVFTTAANTEWYTSAWRTTASQGYIINANPTAAGRAQRSQNVWPEHIVHVKNLLGQTVWTRYWSYGIEQQFLCHVYGGWNYASGVYNMESWQPSLGWASIANPVDRCNRIK